MHWAKLHCNWNLHDFMVIHNNFSRKFIDVVLHVVILGMMEILLELDEYRKHS
jgi:hypothetical protein